MQSPFEQVESDADQTQSPAEQSPDVVYSEQSHIFEAVMALKPKDINANNKS